MTNTWKSRTFVRIRKKLRHQSKRQNMLMPKYSPAGGFENFYSLTRNHRIEFYQSFENTDQLIIPVSIFKNSSSGDTLLGTKINRSLPAWHAGDTFA